MFFRYLLLTLTINTIPSSALADEFHLQLCNISANEAAKRLGFQESSKEIKAISYFDTTNLSYLKQGAIIRFRESTDKVDLTIKVRKKQTKDILPESSQEIKCEHDHYINRSVQSCSIKKKYSLQESFPNLPTIERIKKLLTNAQITYLNHHIKEPLQWNLLQEFGPVPTHIFEKKGFENNLKEVGQNKIKLKLEHRNKYPLTIVELSFKDTTDQFTANRKKLVEKINSLGLKSCALQNSKTKLTIEYLNNWLHKL
ncbi:MAG: hypothetical protein R3B45_15370 [Bdellovibrionota bacterium]